MEIARNLAQLGFTLYATRGTAAVLNAAGLTVTPVNKMSEGRPHIVDMIKNGEMDLIINTVEDKRSAIHDSYSIRHAVLQARVTYYTTLGGRTGGLYRHGKYAGIGSLQFAGSFMACRWSRR